MFGIEIIDASLLPAMTVALLAGGLSFLSPCVLPIVPPYLAFMSGVSVNEMQGGGSARARAGLAALFFVLGLSTVFILLGFTASWLGTLFLQNQVLLARISGVVVIVFGLHFLGLFRIPFLDREARIEVGDSGGSAFGAYILGLAFAFGWTPVSARNWARSCRSRPPRPMPGAARCFWASTRRALAYHSCSRRCS